MIRFLLPLLAAVAAVHAAPRHAFTLEGEPFAPRILPVLSDRKGLPLPGDLAVAGDIPFVLQEPGHYAFRVMDGQVRRLLCRIDTGPERLAGVVIPFGTGALPEADWRTTTLTIRNPPSKPVLDPGPAAPLALPSLPPSLRYLAIHCPARPSPAGMDSTPLESLPELLALTVELSAETLPLDRLRNSRNLRNLDLTGGSITRPGTLASLPALRFLKLRSLQGLESVDFARRLPELRVLKIDGTAVTDLRPLAGATHLRLLSANDTRVTSLPAPSDLPALRDLRLHTTPVSKEKNTIAPFRTVASVLVKNWDPAIRAFEKHDAAHPPPQSPVLFIGSSSIRLWDLRASFPGRPVLNRGFGGSELSDALMYFDRIVLPYRPRVILLYAGDNDIGNGETGGQVVADFEAFAGKVRARLPKAHLAFLPIKPSLQRWELWPAMAEANDAIRKLTATDARLHYLDTATPMLGADGTPRKELFAADGLHLNENGYALWTGIVRPWLDQL